jgi:hypothetical protein
MLSDVVWCIKRQHRRDEIEDFDKVRRIKPPTGHHKPRGDKGQKAKIDDSPLKLENRPVRDMIIFSGEGKRPRRNF